MKRLAPLALLLLAGCHDFEGDRGVLGFSTNVVAHAVHGGWSPDVPVAAGTTAVFVPSRRLHVSVEEDSELGEIAVTGRVSGLDEVWSDGAELGVTGEAGDDGVIRYRGELRDHFSLSFAPVDRIELAEPAIHLAPMVPRPDELLMLEGAEVDLTVAAFDADGQPLGFATTDLVVSGAKATDAGLRVTADADHEVTVEIFGAETSISVRVLQPEDLSHTMRIEYPLLIDGDEHLLVREVGADREGTPVLLPDSGTWLESHAD